MSTRLAPLLHVMLTRRYLGDPSVSLLRGQEYPPAKTVKAAVIVDSIRLVECNKRAIFSEWGVCVMETSQLTVDFSSTYKISKNHDVISHAKPNPYLKS